MDSPPPMRQEEKWEREKNRISLMYTAYIRKHNLESPVAGLMNQWERPAEEFHITLLEMLIHAGETQLENKLRELKGEKPKSDSPVEQKALEYEQLAKETEAELKGRRELRKKIVLQFKDYVNEIESLVEIGNLAEEGGKELIERARSDAKRELDKIDKLGEGADG